jgi:hypothetical protein
MQNNFWIYVNSVNERNIGLNGIKNLFRICLIFIRLLAYKRILQNNIIVV